jgi:hypothetical protein
VPRLVGSAGRRSVSHRQAHGPTGPRRSRRAAYARTRRP